MNNSNDLCRAKLDLMKVAIIGGGAAGMFSAIHVKYNFPDAVVYVFEKSQHVLSKVKISGGGRCNVTNGAESIRELIKAYPRGSKQLKKVFSRFDNHDMIEWLESRGVKTVIQEDRCVFPLAQDSQVIIDCFLSEAKQSGVIIKTNSKVESIVEVEDKLNLHFENGNDQIFDKVIVTTGGSPKRRGLDWLEKLGHQIEDPVPSLFTFNMPQEKIRELMGVVVENAVTKIQGTKFLAEGSLLITHWGMSGPAILILSSWGARFLSEKKYDFKVQVNWVNEANQDKVKVKLSDIIKTHSQKMISNFRPYKLPERLWRYLVEKSEIEETKKWGELSKKNINKITDLLTNDLYSVHGKTTFRDEFVTCGGISLAEVDFNKMQSRKIKNLYFAGEVLDVDAITGGYNFQAAWSMAFVAAQLLE